MKLIFFGTNRYELRRFLAKAIEWRPMNIYNGRGLRFARQLVFRKAGKTSAYR
jgi:ribosomal protein L6P/L9E